MARNRDNGHLSRILNSAEPPVIRRGKDYLARDLVTVTEQIQGTWVGIARGSELYALTLNTNTGKYSCTCPAARPCKHIVAFVFLLRRDFRSGDSASAGKDPSKQELHDYADRDVPHADSSASGDAGGNASPQASPSDGFAEKKAGLGKDGSESSSRSKTGGPDRENYLSLKFVLNEQNETLKLHFSLTGSVSVLPAVLHPAHARLWAELRKEFGYPMQLPLSRTAQWQDLEPAIQILDLNGRTLEFRGELLARPALRELSSLDSRRVLVPCVLAGEEERWLKPGQTCLIEPGGTGKERGFWIIEGQEISPAIRSLLHTALQPEQILASLKSLKMANVDGLEPFEKICKAGPALRISLDYSIDTDLWLHGEMDLVYARSAQDLRAEYLEPQPDGPVHRPVYPVDAQLAFFWPPSENPTDEPYHAMSAGKLALRNPGKEKRLLSRLVSKEAIFSIFDFSRLSPEFAEEWQSPGVGRIAVFDDGFFALNGAALQEFMHALPALLDSGIRVEFSRELIRLFRPAPRAKFEIDKPSGIQWFSGRILLPGLSRSEQDRVFQAYRDGLGYAEVREGQWISIDETGLKEIAGRLQAMGVDMDAEGGTNIGRPQWMALQSELAQQLQTSRRMQKFLERSELSVPLMPGQGFRGELRSYQKTGVDFFRSLYAVGVGGVLADEMGLGKTVQALAFLHGLFCATPEEREGQQKSRDPGIADAGVVGGKNSGHRKQTKSGGRKSSEMPTLLSPASAPMLVVCPVSAISVWTREARRFCPSLPVTVWHGTGRKQTGLPESGLILTTYALLHRDSKILGSRRYSVIFVDEAQNVRNARTAVARSLRAMDARSVFCLTGTPLENHLVDFWSLMDLSVPGLLGTRQSFLRRFDSNPDRLAYLRKLTAPFLLRRTKDQVIRELPDKTEIESFLPMEKRQAIIYESVREEAVQRLEEAGKEYMMRMLPYLMRLRRIACHPDTGKDNCDPLDSGKFAYLKELLLEIESGDSAALIFSQFTDVLNIAEKMLDSLGFPFFRIDGSTSRAKREKQVDLFQSGERSFFLISLKAGGTALTLHRADRVIHLDPWWNPAAQSQATDRAHRIGQKKRLFVYRLFSKDTVEERVLELQTKKKALFNSLFAEDASATSTISREELIRILQ